MDSTFFKHCSWDNPVFYHGSIWFAIFVVTSIWTLYFKVQEYVDAEVKSVEETEVATPLPKIVEEKPKAKANKVKVEVVAKKVEVVVKEEPKKKTKKEKKVVEEVHYEPEPLKQVTSSRAGALSQVDVDDGWQLAWFTLMMVLLKQLIARKWEYNNFQKVT